MKVTSRQLPATLNNLSRSVMPDAGADLVLVYGNPFSLEEPMLLNTFKKSFPNACIAGCSSDGVFIDGQSYENSVIYTVIDFDKTLVRQARANLPEDDRNEYLSGEKLATQLLGDDLVSVIVFCEGTKLDCHQLLEGVRNVLGSDISIWGGLASDKTGFDYTVVIDNEGVYGDGVVAVGLYGKDLVVDMASSSYDKTGIEIDITRADDNIIHEINDQPAAKALENILNNEYDAPISSMSYFPIIKLDSATRRPMFSRIVYYKEEESHELYSAGSVSEGPAKLVNMLDPNDNLNDAVQTSMKLKNPQAELALIASCAGRKGRMKTDWFKESALIHENLGNIPSFGFYAYGEIGKNRKENPSILHNHTLSMVTLYEA